MPKQGRSLDQLWNEILSLFDNESEEDFFQRATYYANPGLGIAVMDQWVWEKYLRQRKGLEIMPRGKAKTSPSNPVTTQSFKGFVSVDLSEDQFAAFDASYPKAYLNPKLFNEFGETYKLTVTPQNGSWNACAFPQTGPNVGYAMSAFSDSAHEAMCLVMFKVMQVHNDAWSQKTNERKRRRG